MSAWEEKGRRKEKKRIEPVRVRGRWEEKNEKKKRIEKGKVKRMNKYLRIVRENGK